MKVPPAAWRLLKPLAVRARARGAALYAVGGCVRDWLLGRPCLDLDVAVEGNAAPLADYCAGLLGARAQPFGQFGTLRVVARSWRVDFARTRRERYPRPASLPEVEPALIREDLFRRDFTINAMAVPLEPRGLGRLVDPYEGLADLRARRLRVLHEASFRDDPTRIFRAARFIARFRLRPAAGLLALAAEALSAGHAFLVSRHRLAHELLRILEEDEPSQALRLLKRWGYLALIHPRMKLPRAWPSGSDPWARLGALALAMGAEGDELLDGLPLERSALAPLRQAWETAAKRSSPRGELPALARRLVSLAHPDLPKDALRPLWVGGEDLAALGLPPGAAYRALLDEAARLQWRGKLPSRAAALAWLRARVKPA